MNALQFIGEGIHAVTEIVPPDIEDDEVLLTARSVGICHSDIDLLHDRYIIPFSFPVIPGHERFSPGGRVVGECVIGQEHFGFSISGAAAELFVAKEGWLHALPDELSFLRFGSCVLELLCIDNDREDSYARSNADLGSTHVCIDVPDLRAAHRQLQAKGIEFLAPPPRHRGGAARRVFLRLLEGPQRGRARALPERWTPPVTLGGAL